MARVKQMEESDRWIRLAANDPAEARKKLREQLNLVAGIQSDNELSLSETIANLDDLPIGEYSKSLGILAIRILSDENLFAPSGPAEPTRHLVSFIDKGCGDLVEKHSKDWKKSQTHEKALIAKAIHADAITSLDLLQKRFTNLEEVLSNRQNIMKALSNGKLGSYLEPFGFGPVKTTIASCLTSVASVVSSEGTQLQGAIVSLVETLREDIQSLKESSTFIVQDFALPFLTLVEDRTLKLEESLSDTFACSILVPQKAIEFEKNYPLHVIGKEIRLYIPLTNSGPGIAQNVEAICIGNSCRVLSDETQLGNISEGSFILTLIFEVAEVTDSIELNVEISWGTIGNAETQTVEFSVLVEAQKTDLDWETMSYKQPYSLEIAYGEDFYGRKDALKRILRRLSPNTMQSCYIAGQKRVGKSSLAHTVEQKLLGRIHHSEYQVLYLECGGFRHSNGEATLNFLGRSIDEFLTKNLPASSRPIENEYGTSLAPLNQILDLLGQINPESRFVVILDEFDEINEDLYLFGELAETFFLNLRTLSSKRNISFILVGAERMPHVMSSQGEKLNRFEKESLDSFDRETEWGDYVALVQNPIGNTIRIHESAINQLYDYTNGHPYFTKMLCTAFYESAVVNKDAEVSREEIQAALRRTVSTLDVNPFVHYWRDGIPGGIEETEIVSQKRSRILLAWARTERASKPLTLENIRENIHSQNLEPTAALPLLEEMCRRKIFTEKNGEYRPTVRLFYDWLVELGFSMLITNQLGDDLIDAQRRKEDEAYVKPQEIIDVVKTWDLYQGVEVSTEHVRAWLNQVETNSNQRLLFTILKKLRFVKEPEIREKFQDSHSWLRNKLPQQIRTRKVERFTNTIVSYADGEGKSGNHYANIYARANEITTSNVLAPSKLVGKFSGLSSTEQMGLAIVDDMIGTGYNLIEKLTELQPLFSEVGIGIRFPLSIIVFCGTVEGEKRIRKFLEVFPNSDLYICETLGNEHCAFTEGLGIWQTDEEKSRAKTLMTDLGVKIQKRKPLGYGDQGLLLTFSRNCPNNTLPILHKQGKVNSPWNPLFLRSNS